MGSKLEGPRYAAYCAAHGSSTELEQIERDEALPGEWPVPPFVHWIGHRIEDWCAGKNLPPNFMGWEDHAQFNDWLCERFGVVVTGGETAAE